MIKIKQPRFNFVGCKDNLNHIKDEGGIYMLYDKNDTLLYIGKASSLKSRLRQHFNGTTNLKDVSHNFDSVMGFYCDCPVQRAIYEIYLINELKPKLNTEHVYTYQSERHFDKYKSKEQIEKETRLQIEMMKAIEQSNL